jgi:VWFA-related protein
VRWISERVVALAAAGSCWTAAAAQTPKPDPPRPQTPAFRTGTDLAVVEATIVDQRGAPLPGLTASDFTVEIDGRPREIVSAEFVNPSVRDAAPAPVDPDVSVNTTQAQGRTILFVVDQASLTPQTRSLLETARRWLGTLAPGDRVGLVAIPAPGPRVEPTTLHARVHEALGQTGPSEPALVFTTVRNLSVWEALQIADGDAATRQQVVARECTAGIDNPCPDEIDLAANDMAAMARARVQPVVSGLLQVLQSMRALPGPKHVVLVSAGWPILERTAASEIEPLAAAAAAGQVMVHSFIAERFAMDASAARVSPRPTADREMVTGSVELLTGWTNGQTVRVVGTGVSAFAQLSAALGGYYRLAVRPDRADLDGRPHRIDVRVTRAGANVRGHRRMMAATSEATRVASADPSDELRRAVRGGSVQTAFELRATTYVLGDAATDDRMRIFLAGDVARAAPGPGQVHVAFFDQWGKPEVMGDQAITVAEDGTGRLGGSFAVPAGAFTMRLAVRDAQGGLGTVERTIDARWRPLGTTRATGLALFTLGEGEAARPHPIVDRLSRADRLLMQVEFATTDGVRPDGAGAVFEILRDGHDEALLRLPAELAQSGSLVVAQQTVPVSVLPAGEYRVNVRLAGAPADAALSRRVRVDVPGVDAGAAAAPATASGASPSTTPGRPQSLGALGSFAVARPARFDPRKALEPAMVQPLLARLGSRPDVAPVRPALERIAGGPWPADPTRGPLAEVPLAAHVVAGLARMKASDFESAANDFRSALRLAPDFTPAIVFLGACYAGGGRDLEAASAWQTLLTRERDSPDVHRLAIEAWLRADRAGPALALAKQARTLWPADRSFLRLHAIAALSGGRFREGVALVEELGADADEPLLLMGLGSLYAAGRARAPGWDAATDLAAMRRMREAYARTKGRSLSLVDAWLDDLAK